MYCNNCGKEVAENMKFCTHCGALIEKVNQPTIHNNAGTKCSNCGKNVEKGVMFCTYCGAKIIPSRDEIKNNVKLIHSTGVDSTKVFSKNLIVLISEILLVIFGIIYLVIGIKSFEGNSDAFDWVSDSYRTYGILLHWGICAIFLFDCIQGLLNIIKHSDKGVRILQTSIPLLTTTFLVWIGSLIWKDFEFEDLSIVLYRIFGTYGEVTAVSFILGIIILICGFLCAKIEQK